MLNQDNGGSWTLIHHLLETKQHLSSIIFHLSSKMASSPFDLEDYLEGGVFNNDHLDLEEYAFADESETMESTPTNKTPKQGARTSTFGQDGNIDPIQQGRAQSNPGERIKDPWKQEAGSREEGRTTKSSQQTRRVNPDCFKTTQR